ncbi:hypothetical protein BDV23DRAFT_144856 [Aspergillus alliaceus]|uniref:Uncharacterized protein n=1 Tax=Petromyces alliaceus TaxID=209559 RepID=A0A5N7CPI2_PETAA|nr:hypothetical protein BDV23DRAFT_144856 [Aspergillus alliaceus]
MPLQFLCMFPLFGCSLGFHYIYMTTLMTSRKENCHHKFCKLPAQISVPSPNPFLQQPTTSTTQHFYHNFVIILKMDSPKPQKEAVPQLKSEFEKMALTRGVSYSWKRLLVIIYREDGTDADRDLISLQDCFQAYLVSRTSQR